MYKIGAASALDVINTRVTTLTNERSAVTIMGNRMTACILLIKALGGGWNSPELQSDGEVNKRNLNAKTDGVSGKARK